GVTAFLALVFLYFSYHKLSHTDLWGHLAYGRHLVETGSVPWTAAWPETEPLMPLSQGVRWVNTAWLAQLAGYGTFRAAGVSGLQFLNAASITFCVGLIVWLCWRATRRAWLAVLGGGAFLLIAWMQLAIIRPQLAGMVCFVTLFALLVRLRRPRPQERPAGRVTAACGEAQSWTPLAFVPLLFILWANGHGSFLVGLAVLAAFLCGRAWDVFWKRRSLRAVVRDRPVRRLLLLTELAAVAVLINPYGFGLYHEVWTFAGHPNLIDIVEWDPLTLRSRQGQIFALASLALITAYRLSPRRIRATEVLLLAGLGGLALWSSRLIVWWAPVAAYYLVLHLNAIRRRWTRHRPAVAAKRTSLATVASIGIAWIGFAYTPFGLALIHGEPQDAQRRGLSPQTPVDAVAWLTDHPPQGQVFNTYEWGDYLLWAGPQDVQVFVASHAHLVPEQVWADYMHVIHLSTGWYDVLDRYRVNTVVIDLRDRRPLADRLRRHDGWHVGYEDHMAVILVRDEPL
ncbi:MAG: hypothetical protein ACREJB_01775, partial [Planctomycetaceae bacterium]